MLEVAAADGVDTIICTPHYGRGCNSKGKLIRKMLMPIAASAGIRLLPGMEYCYSNVHEEAELQPLGDGSFLLIDLACPTLPPSIGELFFSLERRGYQIIIAHPERYLTDLDSCEELFRLGAFFQLNADSILGRNGTFCRRMAERMIRNGYCHFIASDAHGEHRTFHLSECRRRLEADCGTDFVELVMERNPQRMLKNLPPEAPEKKQNWFTRIFRRGE
jgi:protein-tyrosine phosphatase